MSSLKCTQNYSETVKCSFKKKKHKKKTVNIKLRGERKGP